MSVMSIFKKKSFYIILVLVLAILGYAIYVKIANDRFEAGEDNVVQAAEAAEDIGRDDTYSVYLDKYKDAVRPNKEIVVDLYNYSAVMCGYFPVVIRQLY